MIYSNTHPCHHRPVIISAPAPPASRAVPLAAAEGRREAGRCTGSGRRRLPQHKAPQHQHHRHHHQTTMVSRAGTHLSAGRCRSPAARGAKMASAATAPARSPQPHSDSTKTQRSEETSFATVEKEAVSTRSCSPVARRRRCPRPPAATAAPPGSRACAAATPGRACASARRLRSSTRRCGGSSRRRPSPRLASCRRRRTRHRLFQHRDIESQLRCVTEGTAQAR